MRKVFLFLILVNFYIPGTAQIIKGTVKDQNTASNPKFPTAWASPEEPNKTNSEDVYDFLPVIEKVYLHSDRTFYYPGDDIWFKAYLIEADSRLLTDHSNNLHVDLISPSSKIIESRVIRIDAGLGNGDIRLPVELPSGRYLLRAYTNYMRNFSENLFFKREIVVVGQTNPESAPPVETVKKENSMNMSFFPEGGSLLDNVSTIVAFKAVDATGRGCEVSGEIYASTGELITKFKSTYQGMGTFFLKPFPGIKYYSVVRSHNGMETKSTIPGSSSSGVTMSVSKTGGNDLQVTIKTNALTLPSLLGDNLLLSISARKKVLKTINFKIKSVTNSFTIETDDLPAGIVMLTLSNNSGLPVSERLIFIQKDKDFAISIEPDKREYEKRDPVSLRISLSADSGFSREAFLSVSAAEKGSDSTSSEFFSTISSWFLLESDVHGIIEEPAYYFNPANINRSTHLDLLLRTQGWRDFTWKYDKKNYFTPETGFSISGRVRRSFSNKPLDDSEVNIGIFEKKETYFTTIPTDTSGRFSLKGIDLTGKARVIVTSIGSKDNPRGMIVLDSSDYAHAGIIGALTLKRQLFFEEDYSEITQKYEFREAVRKKYKLSDTIELGEVSIIAAKTKNLQEIKVENSRATYGEPDDEIIVTKELESYRNVIEMLRGRVAGVAVSGSYPDYEIKIRGTHTISSNATPLVIIDGLRKDFSDLMTMPLHFIDRIDILKSGGATAMYGFSGANGVISIITRTADRIDPYDLPKYSANFIISGYNEARIFYSPQHTNASASGNGPDLRTTLFWKPDISLKTNQEFLMKYFNADNSSTICIVVEGITSDGIPVTGNTEYEVR